MSDGAIEVRQARADDVEQLWPLVRDFATSFRPDRSAFAQTFSKMLDRADTLVLVAATDRDAIVGYLLGSHHGTFFANGPVAWIEELMVAESVRRRGVASALVSSAEAWARSVPCAYIALASRRASAFYVHHGYEESATFLRKLLTTPEE
jgi:GNAT superfamily N-acetyltransferase